MNSEDRVNEHYLDHVVDVARVQEVEASEDIVAGNGMKLLAKGTRISAEVKDRLLQHKLRKPLEDCLRVSGDVLTAQLPALIERELDEHRFLREICGTAPTRRLLTQLKIGAPMLSLLTVYGAHQDGKLAHAARVALFAIGLGHRLTPGNVEQPPQLAAAALMHDVGELYIDPAYLQGSAKLTPDQWKHIATHPIVGHRLLKDMVGAGAAVAQAVLQHHERLDGFGYPFGLRGDQLPLPGQLLSVAEMLSALLESRPDAALQATIAMKLVPGEFSRQVLDVVATAGRALPFEPEAAAETAAGVQDHVVRVERIASVLNGFRQGREWVDQQMSAAPAGVMAVLAAGAERLTRIQLAFTSTGLDAADSTELVRQLANDGTPALRHELGVVLRELDWRIDELMRELNIRMSRIAPSAWDRFKGLIESQTTALRL